jgi:hypothetical protein
MVVPGAAARAARRDDLWAIGVTHHLADPLCALQRMACAVKPGGQVLIRVYGRDGNRRLAARCSAAWRSLSSIVSGSIRRQSGGWRYGSGCGRANLQITRALRPHPSGIDRIQMLPRSAHYWPRERVVELMTEAGLEDVRIASVNEMSWSAIGTWPLAVKP